ncbi:tRNA preQ1(34) S-adenosylmethionine ribosyltransferase-isomerase QueA [Geitlerinema sp. PCC 9228]|uniref:tRNA preQ1(34) S-adenosylmethionine ribosyltransferase-isomerase QueA n=1 Tax=Geitlerinema sp. PCC 9228 TaxID=111611 RepID=UPI000AD5FAC1|nr:tRNA preQ1(34) S-adenosylmethionine ribosyltransferase-isomerase QueA [Geitlerinema sp. PCC 9228]
MDNDFFLSAYDYDLPEERIAQNPVVPRDSSRLLVVDSPTTHQHRIFRDLPQLLQPGDLLVFNDTRVLPARLYGQKSSGAQAEFLLLEPRADGSWLCLVKPGKRLPPGAVVHIPPEASRGESSDWPVMKATIGEVDAATGGRIVTFEVPQGYSFWQVLEAFGEIPFPPYVTQTQAQPEQYQTVYARQAGAVAAPTAGLHFTEELLQRLQDAGIQRAFVTLHVGVGTFRPVETENVTEHVMHGEWFEIPEQTASQIYETQQRGGRILAVGTTVVRSLESAATEDGKVQSMCDKTELFIYPGYRWRVVEGLITNFHLPRSSLLMLVSAMVGRRRLLDLYREAIAEQYRFYSFGDAMLVLPEAKTS